MTVTETGLPPWVLKLNRQQLLDLKRATPPQWQAELQDRLDGLEEEPAEWEPLPHQEPPPEGDYYGWLLLGGRGSGKRLSLDTPLATPSGWTTMGDVRVGDELFDDRGRPCRVTQVSPVAMGDSYRVRFSDGPELIADAEHLWQTWDHAARKSAGRGGAGAPVIRTTTEIATTIRYRDRERNHSILNTAPLVLRGVHTRIDPYVLGVWLGDGASAGGRITVGDEDLAEMTRHIEATGSDVTVNRWGDRASTLRVHGLTTKLRHSGLIGNKHVPLQYRRAAIPQRLALLQGLMDTDGGWATAQAEFAVTSETLANGAYELIVSLGMKATRTKRPAKLRGVEYGTSYRVTFTPTLPVFRLARKLARQRFDTSQQTRRAHRYIDSVEPTASVPMRCIAVDSPTHLYLAGESMIPTHNTAAVTHYMNDHANGPPCLRGRIPHRMGIIAPTLGDASASIVHGDDGLTVINHAIREVSRRGGTVALWPNGAEAHLFGVHTKTDVDRLRAKGNRCFDVREEIAAWRWLKDGMAQADFGLRVGPNPHWIGATTPKPRPTIRALNVDPLVKVNRATTADNPHLRAETRARLYETYGNTRVGLQELEGQILEEVSGALWQQELIDQYRVTSDEVPKLVRVRTYVDPSWGTTNDECGIVVAGLGVNRHVYILADLSKRLTPGEWGVLAALGYLPPANERAGAEPREWFGRRSERTVGEGNFQGEQVRLVMKLVSRELDRRLLFSLVTASKGKRLRAEPVLTAYEQGKVHHVGQMPGLEFQLTTWVPPDATDLGDDEGDPEPPPEGDEEIDESKWSPDRLDAMVFAVTDLLLGAGAGVGKLEVADGRIPRTKATPAGQSSAGPRIGAIPTATRQGRLAAQQMKDKRHS